MDKIPTLMELTRFSGCGAKLGPGVLEKALCGLSQPKYPDLIVSFEGNEDAGLFRVAPGLALVQTVDFFPPIVDDPFLFGRIAAANALSDVYAMGGRPATALALVCFPTGRLGLDTLKLMMEGGLDALVEAGCALLGGHSIDDLEPKLGYAVTGFVDPERAWRNNSLVEGLSLILTKPLGIGLITRAFREGKASQASVAAAHASMATLNKTAAEVLMGYTVRACTDVTGFGLAGHAAEMAAGASCGLRLHASRLPFLPDAVNYAAAGLAPDGTRRNREGRIHALPRASGLNPQLLDLLFDPQTSGGLLAALPDSEADSALAALRAAGVDAHIVGESGGPAGEVDIVP